MSGISAKLDSADFLIEKMQKEAQEMPILPLEIGNKWNSRNKNVLMKIIKPAMIPFFICTNMQS